MYRPDQLSTSVARRKYLIGMLGLSVIVLLPILVVFLAAQRQFVQGAAMGGLKG